MTEVISMNRLTHRRTIGLSGKPLFVCASIFLLAGILGTAIQSHLMGPAGMTNSTLLAQMQENPGLMTMATISLVFQALQACAIPIAAFLCTKVAESNLPFSKYLLILLGVAVVVQIPYTFLLAGTGLNVVFAIVMGMVLLYFFRRFPGKNAGHMLIKTVALLGTFLWSNILGIHCGASCVIITAVLWASRDKKTMQVFFGLIVTLLCSVFSIFNMIAPISFAVLHLYNGELGIRAKES